MKWIKKQKKDSPNDGELRIISKFLYYPMCIDMSIGGLKKLK